MPQSFFVDQIDLELVLRAARTLQHALNVLPPGVINRARNSLAPAGLDWTVDDAISLDQAISNIQQLLP